MSAFLLFQIYRNWPKTFDELYIVPIPLNFLSVESGIMNTFFKRVKIWIK